MLMKELIKHLKQKNSLEQIFSIYHMPTTSNYLQTDFYDDTKYHFFLDIINNRDSHNFNTNALYTYLSYLL